MDDLLKTLFEGQELSQEFKDKVQAVFESALEEKETEIQEQVETKYEKISEDYAEYVVEEMETKTQEYLDEEVMPMVEKYLDYATGEFLKENKLAVESGTKVELAEQFLTGMVGIAESFNVSVPEGKDDYITEMETKVSKLQERFDRALDEKAQLEQEITESKMAGIVDSKVKDLTESQKEKFFKVASKVKFQDEDQYASSINELYESYFPTEQEDFLTEQQEEEKLNEEKLHKPEGKDDWLSQIMSRV